MRTPTLLTLGLISVALLPAQPVAAARGGGLPSCLSTMSGKPALAPYVNYMMANTKVMRAFRACKFPAQALAWFISKLETAELSGEIPSAPSPVSLSTRLPNVMAISLTDDEGNESIGAKLAHLFYIEVTQKVAWRLADYSSSDLTTLFDLLKYYRGVDSITPGDAFGSYMMYYVADYSPLQAWSVLQQTFDIMAVADPHAAMAELMRHARQFRHGSPSLDNDLGIVSIEQMAAARVSNWGCQSMAPYMMGLAAALNIPGSTIRGYYAGGDHRSALFPALDLVVDHGDAPYDALMDATPARLIFDSYQRWQSEVLVYQPYQGPASPAAYFSQKYHYTIGRLYPSFWVMERYCGMYGSYPVTGRAYLEDTFKGYATAVDFDAMEEDIRQKTSGCTVIPLDNPDATF